MLVALGTLSGFHPGKGQGTWYETTGEVNDDRRKGLEFRYEGDGEPVGRKKELKGRYEKL